MTNLLSLPESELEQLAPQCREAIDALQPAITRLLAHYQDWFDCNNIEEEERPEKELAAFIRNFDLKYPTVRSVRRLKIALRAVIAGLGCFCYRTVAINDQGKVMETWQPLSETFREFRARHRKLGHRLQQTGSLEDPYPPVDMINSWVDRELGDAGQSVFTESGESAC